MTHGSLFSGIGGFDLAAEWMGWENKFHCEWNEFGQKVLKYYWPNAELFTDITKSDFTKYADKIDVLTGGFPCQPYSMAGKRLGKEDERHLWPEMLRAIREIKPSWVVGENVLGLVNWSGGLVFHEVQTDLEAEGYEVFPFVLPAASVNAPHKRDRVWFVAYANYKRGSSGLGQVQKKDGEIPERNYDAKSCDTSDWDVTNSTSIGFCSHSSRTKLQFETFRTSERLDKEDATDTKSESGGWKLQQQSWQREFRGCDCKPNNYIRWQNFPTVSPICNGDDGLSNRLDSITFSKWRNESIKAGGNAIVPQVVYQIFKTIQQYEHQRTSNTTD
jgi:DNA (cytosine-5)-methyltransferase 1